jgi:hypothetical protein
MTHYELSLFLSIAALEILLCFLVYSRRLQGRLPLFAVYATTMLISCVVLGFVFAHFGFRSVVSYHAFWVVGAVTLIARSLAIGELCHESLKPYRGIWGLAWRLLASMTFLFFLHAALDAAGQPNRLAIYGLTLERDLDIASITILAVLLLIHNYYGLSLESVQKQIAVGIFIFCAVDVISNTVLRNLLTGFFFPWFLTSRMSLWPTMRPQVERVRDMWNAIYFISSVISMGIWCFALRRPLPEPAEAPSLLPAEVYRDLSPAINLRLRAFNDRLMEMLKP